jgi:cell shape-determining protein MreC
MENFVEIYNNFQWSNRWWTHWISDMLLFDKSNAQSTQLKTEVKWSKYNLNMMNLYKEEYHQILDMNQIVYSECY